MKNLTPRQIVQELDRYIIGQEEAKKVVAVALRNRYRRSKLPKELQDEVTPKNIILIGPTGVGKTEIARRLAKLVDAPFVKVEATKFTEVGYVGRDVESMVRDLVNVSIRNVKHRHMEKVRDKAKENVEDIIVDLLKPLPRKNKKSKNPFEMLFNSNETSDSEINTEDENYEVIKSHQHELKEKLRNGELEDEIVEIEVEDNTSAPIGVLGGMSIDENLNINDLFNGLLPKKTKKRRLPVKEARDILIQQEAQSLIDMDSVTSEGLKEAEENGIIFLDEIDKIAEKGSRGGSPDVSREGVQRDILPIVEGSTVNTKYGPVSTDHILFIGAGAFHTSKVSDLIPELQGRFPINVHLKNLTKENFVSILTKPENAIIKQYKELLKTENIELVFEEDAIEEIASIATHLNEQHENIGARRLHTVIEKLVEEISFYAPDYDCNQFVVTVDYVKNTFNKIGRYEEDIKKYIL